MDRYLFVVNGLWVIKSSLDTDAKKALMRSGSSSQICPAHPSNFSTQKPDLDHNIWEFNKVDENQDEKWEEGGIVFLRCSVHDADHAQWLVEQARGGQMEKEKVGAILCEEDNKESVLLSLLDKDVQKEVSLWNRNRTNMIAHLLSQDHVQWLVQQAMEGKWGKEEAADVVFRKNADDQLVMATLDEETQKQAAVFNKDKTCSIVPFMEDDGNFLRWLFEEAEKGEWDQKMVFDALAKEEVDGKAVIVARRKKGKTFVNIQHHILFKTNFSQCSFGNQQQWACSRS